VSVGGSVVGAFDGPGLVVLVGVTHDDTSARASRLADKVYDLRIFGPEHSAGDHDRDSAGELSAADLRLPVLVVSQFTLYADTRKGRRPTWDAAAPASVAEPLADAVAERLRQRGAIVATGVFGAEMRLTLTNDGPMTISIEV
jgi:D-tyrosyl-tRNA(Tyr) deacylase